MELVRHIVGRLRDYLGNRRHAPRKQLRLPVTVSFHDVRANREAPRRARATLNGVTHDLSSTGLALILPAIRIGERYLTGADTTLRLALEHPTGPMQIIVSPVRYEQLDESATDTGYLIGVKIKEMTDEDRARFIEHLSRLR